MTELLPTLLGPAKMLRGASLMAVESRKERKPSSVRSCNIGQGFHPKVETEFQGGHRNWRSRYGTFEARIFR